MLEFLKQQEKQLQEDLKQQVIQQHKDLKDTKINWTTRRKIC